MFNRKYIFKWWIAKDMIPSLELTICPWNWQLLSQWFSSPAFRRWEIWSHVSVSFRLNIYFEFCHKQKKTISLQYLGFGSWTLVVESGWVVETRRFGESPIQFFGVGIRICVCFLSDVSWLFDSSIGKPFETQLPQVVAPHHPWLSMASAARFRRPLSVGSGPRIRRVLERWPGTEGAVGDTPRCCWLQRWQCLGLKKGSYKFASLKTERSIETSSNHHFFRGGAVKLQGGSSEDEGLQKYWAQGDFDCWTVMHQKNIL